MHAWKGGWQWKRQRGMTALGFAPGVEYIQESRLSYTWVRAHACLCVCVGIRIFVCACVGIRICVCAHACVLAREGTCGSGCMRACVRACLLSTHAFPSPALERERGRACFGGRKFFGGRKLEKSLLAERVRVGRRRWVQVIGLFPFFSVNPACIKQASVKQLTRWPLVLGAVSNLVATLPTRFKALVARILFSNARPPSLSLRLFPPTPATHTLHPASFSSCGRRQVSADFSDGLP